MKTILLSLLMFASSVIFAIDPNTTSHYLKAGGTKVKIDESEFWIAKVPKAVWESVNAGRKLQNKAIQTFERVNSEPWANADYVGDWLDILRIDLQKEMNSDPNSDQLFVAWMIGIEKFKKAGFKVDTAAKGELGIRLELFRALETRPQAAIPSALPTDGRRAIPTRYPKDYDHAHR